MKIGIVSPYFYPWYGGITEHVYYLYKGLKELGHHVKIITSYSGEPVMDQTDDLIKIGFPVPLILNGSVVKIPIIRNRGQLVDRIIAQENFDLIHLHQPLFCLLSLTFLNRIKHQPNTKYNKVKIVGTFHACGGGGERFILKQISFLFKKYIHDFDVKIAVSDASEEFIRPILPGDYNVIPNGVDYYRFSNEKEKITKFIDDIFNILFVGRLEPRKGLSNLLKSISILKTITKRKFRLIVVGNGILTNYYKMLVPDDVAENINFVGHSSFSDLSKYYKTAHLFCSPATYGESFGIVLIEAMAAGLPIVAGDNEGYRKVISNGVNGFLVDADNPLQIAEKIALLMESEHLRCAFGENNIVEAQKYSWASIVKRINSLYAIEYLAKQNIGQFSIW
jgi:phosphatidylinositol alpha-mannosyltransferase